MDQILTMHSLMIAVILILILVILLTIVLLIFGFREYKNVYNRMHWKKELDDYLMNIVVSGTSDQFIEDKKISEMMKSETFKLYFLNQLIESKRKFSGISSKSLQQHFLMYGLDEKAVELLKQDKPYLISRGIEALTSMDLVQYLPEIKRKTSNNNVLVVQEVQYALAFFEGFNGLSFLNTLDTLLSEWQQLRILDSIKSIPKDAVSQLRIWLKSENPSVVKFSLKLVRKFQLYELHDDLFELINHHDESVQVKLLRTLFRIETFGTADKLVEIFPTLSLTLQKEIIQGLGETGAKNHIQFLKNNLMDYPTDDGKIEIAYALFSLGEQNYLYHLKDQLEPLDPRVLVLDHVLQNKK